MTEYTKFITKNVDTSGACEGVFYAVRKRDHYRGSFIIGSHGSSMPVYNSVQKWIEGAWKDWGYLPSKVV